MAPGRGPGAASWPRSCAAAGSGSPPRRSACPRDCADVPPGCAAMWPGMVNAAPVDRNTLWMVFTHPGCCHPYVNREEQLSSLVAQLRGAYGRHLGEPAWTSFVARLQAASTQFAQLWAEQHVASNMTYLKIFRHPAHPR